MSVRVQRVAIVLVVLALIVGLETLVLNRCSREENGPAAALNTAEPTATPEAPQEQATTPPSDTAGPAATTPPVGMTSPPVGAQSGGSTTAQATNAPQQQATNPPVTNPPVTNPPATDPPQEQAPQSGSVTASNSFSSSTGTALNMGVSWQAVDQGDGTTTINITGTANSYALNVGSKSLTISFSGYSASVMTNSINTSANSLVQNTLFTTSMNVATGTSGTMTVTWDYNGAYGDVSLPSITASDYVYTN